MMVKKRWGIDASVGRKGGPGRPKKANFDLDEMLLNYLPENLFQTARNAACQTIFPSSCFTNANKKF